MLAFARCVPPDLKECLLHGVLRVALIAQDAQRQTEGDPRDAVIELGERALVSPRNERNQGLVGQMSLVLAHGEAAFRRAKR